MPARAPKASRYLEVERKFDVADSAVSPSFDGIAAVARVEKLPTQSLDATYFDTPAQNLARNKITLRRRTGGSDAGWHLKLPAGPDARTEVRAPLDAPDGEGVPGELRDIVLAIVRDRPLTPVARISTERETRVLYGMDGAALAEFSNDHVTAWSIGASPAEQPAEQEWREWELELVTTDRAPDTELLTRLGNRLLDAGAAPAGHASKLARVLGPTVQPDDTGPPADPVRHAVAEQVGALLVWDRAVRADADDAVHQMRVTIRKIRSLLGESPEFASSADAWVLDELRELGNVLGGARDAEVLGARYRQALDGLPPELVRGGVRERLIEGARRRYQAGLRRSLAAMRSQRYFRLLNALDAVVAHPPAAVAGRDAAPVTIDAAYQKVRRAAKAAARAPQEHRDEALHRIRKRAKRLRYTGAATGAAEVSERAKAIQTLLGEHQDSVVSREHLLRQADAAHAAGEDTFTYGLLYQQEVDLAQTCERQVDDALRALDKSVRKAQR
ncbi:CYTH and CHAD domain-containing protein [Mycobacterium helveticum]|jgi:CHAD domain-containing protein|uniref:CYTH and CHAD domain-containing protein n=1 Tax=Mycobacterium helveticum TaxID=2592811 RepID=A0A557XP77_9MYCO|nr:CYTH and CHAD domain-containing protein [Mycobacterium helveticum]TVS87689.1 CYTH and CHAD domain-containing protein [Mycobacterium helveticum]TVS88134.1 CYTH and CHAD domain-containing protein [Mycobacterium helveticum]